MHIRTCVRQSAKSFCDFNEIWHLGRGRREIHDGMQRPIEGQCQGHEPFKVGNSAICKRILLRHLQWQLTTDHGFLSYRAQYLNVIGPDFWYLAGFLCYVTLKLARSVCCKESTVRPRSRLIFSVSLFFRFCGVHKIKLAISSGFDRTLICRIVSYRIVREISRPKDIYFKNYRPESGHRQIHRSNCSIWTTKVVG